MFFYRHRFQFFFMALLFLAGCEDKQLSQTTVEFEGVQFPVPEGWNNVKPSKSEFKAEINHVETSKGGQKTKNVDQVMLFQVGTPTSQKLPPAEAVAKERGGINPQDFLLDGVNAIRVEMPNKNRFLVIAYNNGKAYLVIGSADKNADLLTPFNQVLKTWKWTK